MSNQVNVGTISLVSVIIPSYNHEKYVEVAIRSIWEQTYKNIELIVIDDGSKDNSVEIIKHLEKISPIQMSVVVKSNEGICKTLNLGLSLSKGKYICFIASDDMYLPSKIFSQVMNLESVMDDNVAGCYGNSVVIDREGNQLNERIKFDMFNNDQFRLCVKKKYQAGLGTSTFISEKIKNIKFDSSLYFEDWDFFLRLSMSFKMLYLPSFVYNYRKLDSGANRNVEKMIIARNQIFEKYKKHPRFIEYGVKQFESIIYISNANSLYYIGDFDSCKKWLLKALLVDPLCIFNNLSLYIKILLGKKMISVLKKIRMFLNEQR